MRLKKDNPTSGAVHYDSVIQSKPKTKNQPTNRELYSRVKAEAKKKFEVYPSAYANAWLVREYKSRGGKYKGE